MEKETYTLGNEAITCPYCCCESREFKHNESYTKDNLAVHKYSYNLAISGYFAVSDCWGCGQPYLVQLRDGKILNYHPEKKPVTFEEQVKKNAERREVAETLCDAECYAVKNRCLETGEIYIEGYRLGDRNLLPETHEFDTLDEFLEHLIVSIEALDSHFYRADWKDQELRDLIYKAKVEILTEYFEKSSNPGFFESKKDYYRERLDYALVIARSASYSIVNRDMHYYDDEDRYNPEYTSLNSDVNYLLNAKERFEESEEMDPYVLELANSLSRRYDYSY
ncbi:hypothetical protein [Turicibacter sp.]|uniref:hypothetical protein n=1 Tax=Turicibacter sp. TaxID=2049042 RepID=UPI001B4CBD74|nr:hypothetical protein [Turicibacter sp.]MBP3903569.1 hypothetical protein [Turicibacter sp.]MBP3908088.1 hypothetical protein [Turicibacter sp.]